MNCLHTCSHLAPETLDRKCGEKEEAVDGDKPGSAALRSSVLSACLLQSRMLRISFGRVEAKWTTSSTKPLAARTGSKNQPHGNYCTLSHFNPYNPPQYV